MYKEYIASLEKEYNMEQIMQDLHKRFPIERISKEYINAYEKKNPLVTVITLTYNRGQRLVNYSLKSTLAQTYKNLQIIVIGDQCTDDTDELMSTITDNRLIYTNLLKRTSKGEDTAAKWAQAGCIPHNYALQLVEGDFIAQLDDDDYMIPERIEKLVEAIQTQKVDFIHHPFALGTVGNIKEVNPSEKVERGSVTTSAIFFHQWFKQLPGDIHCYEKYQEPGDWNKTRKMLELGMTHYRLPEVLTIKDYGDIERGRFVG